MAVRRKDRFSEAVVGVFMVVVIALMAYFTIVISGVDVLSGRSKSRVKIAFDQVGGLKDRDNVMYRGTKVGVVHSVEVTPTNLIVIADIDHNVVLRERYRATVCNLSMLGGNYLLLEEGDGAVIDPCKRQLSGEPPTDWMRDFAEVSKNLRVITETGSIKSIVTNIEVVSSKAVTFADQAIAFADKANAVADKANSIAKQAGTIADKAEAVVSRVERGEGTLGRLVSKDTKVYDDIEKSLADIAAIVERVNRGEGTFGRLLSKDDTLYNDLKGGVDAFRKAVEGVDAKATLAKANELADNLNAVALRLKNGEGTLGKLTSADDKMYDEINGLIRDVRQIIDNYRDTTPISTFSSLATGAL